MPVEVTVDGRCCRGRSRCVVTGWRCWLSSCSDHIFVVGPWPQFPTVSGCRVHRGGITLHGGCNSTRPKALVSGAESKCWSAALRGRS